MAGVLAGVAVGFGIHSWKKNRPTADELERRRRLGVATTGKLSDGTLTEVRGECLIFSYDVGGMEYTAAQDVSTLSAILPDDHWKLIGPVTVKYEIRNPANSIIISEHWSGLRKRQGDSSI